MQTQTRGHLATIPEGKVESEARNAFCLGTGGHFQGLNDAGITLMLKARVLALGVLTDNGKVDIGVASGNTWERLAQDYRSVDIKLLTHGHVPGEVTGL
jgi:hypothetical protein